MADSIVSSTVISAGPGKAAARTDPRPDPGAMAAPSARHRDHDPDVCVFEAFDAAHTPQLTPSAGRALQEKHAVYPDGRQLVGQVLIPGGIYLFLL